MTSDQMRPGERVRISGDTTVYVIAGAGKDKDGNEGFHAYDASIADGGPGKSASWYAKNGTFVRSDQLGRVTLESGAGDQATTGERGRAGLPPLVSGAPYPSTQPYGGAPLVSPATPQRSDQGHIDPSYAGVGQDPRVNPTDSPYQPSARAPGSVPPRSDQQGYDPARLATPAGAGADVMARDRSTLGPQEPRGPQDVMAYDRRPMGSGNIVADETLREDNVRAHERRQRVGLRQDDAVAAGQEAEADERWAVGVALNRPGYVDPRNDARFNALDAVVADMRDQIDRLTVALKATGSVDPALLARTGTSGQVDRASGTGPNVDDTSYRAGQVDPVTETTQARQTFTPATRR